MHNGPLLFRPDLIEDESLANYLYRLAKANRYPSMTYITELLNINVSIAYGNYFPEEAIDRFAALTLHNKEELFNKTVQVYEGYLGKNANHLIHKSNVKCCPLCIDLDLIHKPQWNLNFVNICPIHYVFLIDKCEGCNGRLSFPSLIDCNCVKCGFDLRKSKQIVVHPTSIFYVSQQFLFKLLKEKKAPFIFDINLKNYMELSLRSLILMDGLPSFVDIELDNPQIHSLLTIKMSLCNQNYAVAFANVYWMYENYPQNFYKVLDVFYQKPYLKRKYPRKRFEELFQSGDFQLVQNSYLDFWKQKVKEGNVHHNFQKSKQELHNIDKENLTKYGVMGRFGYSKNEVNEIWRHKEHLMGMERGGKKQWLLSNESFDKLQMDLDNWKYMLTKKEAISILGIAVKMFNRLVESGYIQVKHMPWQKNDFFDKRDLNNLIKKYVENSPVLESGIRLHDAIRKYEKKGLNIESVLKLIDSKKLKPYLAKGNGSFDELIFETNELSECLEYAFIDGQIMYTLTNVEKKFKMEKPTLHRMIQKGILNPGKTTITSGGKKRYYFSVIEIDEFLQRHISVPDAALEYKVSRDSLYRLLRKGKIKNVLEGVSKIHLLKKDELTNILLQKKNAKNKIVDFN